MNDHLMNVYARMPVAFVRGEGVHLFDEDGRRYLDAITGIGVCSLGHAHPEIASAIADQAATLIHTSNIPRIPLQEKLANRLAEISGLDRLFFTNSGAEAVECAIKLARQYASQKGNAAPQILVVGGSFHGRTLACISATDNSSAQAGFAPLLPGFPVAPFGDVQAVASALAANPDIAAILLEPIQGEGGINVPPDGYLPALRELCDQHDALLILDEVQSGVCKSGRWFAWQYEDVQPDIVAIAKALGNGFPVGACLARETVAQAFRPGHHGSTYGGNPLACRVALTVLEIMSRDGIAQRAAQTGEWFLAHLRQRLAALPAVTEVRGRGMMIGVALDRPAADIKQYALEMGVLTNVTRGSVIRLLPPLIIEKAELEQLAEVLASAIERLCQ